jgi:hypothetical protein
MKKKFLKVGALAAAAVSAAVPAMADTGINIDYSGAVTAILAQVSTAITAALPVLGAMLGIYIGVKIFKRFAK